MHVAVDVDVEFEVVVVSLTEVELVKHGVKVVAFLTSMKPPGATVEIVVSCCLVCECPTSPPTYNAESIVVPIAMMTSAVRTIDLALVLFLFMVF